MSAYQTVLKSFAYLHLQFIGELPQTNDHALFLMLCMSSLLVVIPYILEKNIVLQAEGM